MQVHDELLFEVSSSQLTSVAALVRRVMEGTAAVWGIQLPLPVKVSVGPSWGQLTRYEQTSQAS
jgi:DNA polymerase I-like protein with 3'-5' exonuclease and polymerase domains